MKLLSIVALIWICFASGCGQGSTQKPMPMRKWIPVQPWQTSNNAKDHAFSKIKIPQIVLFPSKKTFFIPKRWMPWLQDHGGNIATSREELEAVAVGQGEWDSEYASVLNAAFPFDRCCVHGGATPWSAGAGYRDVQLRVYDLEMPADKACEQFVAKSCEEIQRIIGHEIVPRTQKSGRWNRIVLSFDLRFYDYIATANVDCFFRAVGGNTIVFAFMHTQGNRDEDTITEIIESFDPEQLF